MAWNIWKLGDARAAPPAQRVAVRHDVLLPALLVQDVP